MRLKNLNEEEKWDFFIELKRFLEDQGDWQIDPMNFVFELKDFIGHNVLQRITY